MRFFKMNGMVVHQKKNTYFMSFLDCNEGIGMNFFTRLTLPFAKLLQDNKSKGG